MVWVLLVLLPSEEVRGVLAVRVARGFPGEQLHLQRPKLEKKTGRRILQLPKKTGILVRERERDEREEIEEVFCN